ncbi:hypothetical protein HXX01_03440, partial [Candidatus Nomurabacteria bacterium]|nr:hypothetical protein [Candidatus Nomurabacteria bacterium]
MENKSEIIDIIFENISSISQDYIEEKESNGYWYNHDDEKYFSYVVRDVKHKGFIATDIDFVFYSTTKNRLIFIDHKTRKSNLRPGQEKVFKLMDAIMRKQEYIKYGGFYVLEFEYSTFEDGNVWLKKPFDETWEDMIIPTKE